MYIYLQRTMSQIKVTVRYLLIADEPGTHNLCCQLLVSHVFANDDVTTG